MSPTAPFLAPERDDDLKEGRGKSGAEFFVLPGQSWSSLGTFALTAGTDYYTVFWVASPLMADQLVCEVTTLSAANNLRMGLYSADANWQPRGAPLADSGDISTATTGVKTYTPSAPIYFRRGRYLTVLNSSGTPTMRANRASLGTLLTAAGPSNYATRLSVTRAYAAFPTPGTAWDTTSALTLPHEAMVFLRVLAP